METKTELMTVAKTELMTVAMSELMTVARHPRRIAMRAKEAELHGSLTAGRQRADEIRNTLKGVPGDHVVRVRAAARLGGITPAAAAAEIAANEQLAAELAEIEQENKEIEEALLMLADMWSRDNGRERSVNLQLSREVCEGHRDLQTRMFTKQRDAVRNVLENLREIAEFFGELREGETTITQPLQDLGSPVEEWQLELWLKTLDEYLNPPSASPPTSAKQVVKIEPKADEFEADEFELVSAA